MDRGANPSRRAECANTQSRSALSAAHSEDVLYRVGHGPPVRHPESCPVAVESQLARAAGCARIRAEREGSGDPKADGGTPAEGREAQAIGSGREAGRYRAAASGREDRRATSGPDAGEYSEP